MSRYGRCTTQPIGEPERLSTNHKRSSPGPSFPTTAQRGVVRLSPSATGSRRLRAYHVANLSQHLDTRRQDAAPWRRRSAHHLWTPPSTQGKTYGLAWRVVGCCHLSGLRCGRKTAAGLYGSSRTGSRSPEACSRHCGKPWLSQPRLADCCAILPSAHPYVSAIV